MFEKHKQPSVEAGILIADKAKGFAKLGTTLFSVVLVVVSVFAIGLGSGNDSDCKEGNRITGMGKIAAGRVKNG